jgi:hypothetical protein
VAELIPIDRIATDGTQSRAALNDSVVGFPGENAKFFTVGRHGQHHSQRVSHLRMLITG